MSDILNQALSILSSRLDLSDFDKSLRIELAGQGALRVDQGGVRISDEEADCTLSAAPEVFEGLLAGDVNPTMAFMSGKLSVDGDMSVAMKLASMLG